MEKRSVTLTVALVLSIVHIASAATAQQDRVLTVRMASAMDANRDGEITRDEFFSVTTDEALWAKLDRNADGVVDAQELRRGVSIPRHTRH